MFCPLCKAEFREGFTECSDCHVSLVATKQDANAAAVVSVWRGGNKQELEAVLTALSRNNIPVSFRQHRSAASATGQAFLSLFLLSATEGLSREFEVTVFESDGTRAQAAIENALSEPDDD